MPSPAILLVAGSGHALERVEWALDSHPVLRVHSLAECLGHFEDGWFPELVVVCQHWPDEYTSRDVCALISRWPLARLLCVYGPWCEGEGRTRDVWPLALRVPEPEAAFRVAQELEVIAGGTGGLLAHTASRSEIFEASCRPSSPSGSNLGTRPRTVAIVSPDLAWKAMIEVALRDGGFSIEGDVRRAESLVWDADPDLPERREDLMAWRTEHPQGAAVVVRGFCFGSAPNEPPEPLVWKLSPLGRILNALTEHVDSG